MKTLQAQSKEQSMVILHTTLLMFFTYELGLTMGHTAGNFWSQTFGGLMVVQGYPSANYFLCNEKIFFHSTSIFQGAF